MKLDRAKLPIGIILFVILFLGIKLLFNGSNTLRPNDDGSVPYKKSAVGDDYLYRITDTIAFKAHLLPTMNAISINICSYKKAGFIEGLFLGKNKAKKDLFYPTDIKGDWVYTVAANNGDYFAINIKTGELLKNETGSNTLYETAYFKEKFDGGKSLDDRYVIKTFEPLNTYKSSGMDMIFAAIAIGIICAVWFIIALIIDVVKPRNKTAAATVNTNEVVGNRPPEV